jgi:saccharopine dehydrogenase-like NADP-dependent oxidoreductase
MSDVRVLGCGMVGSAIARDLAASGHRVRVFDNSPESLERVSDEPGIEAVVLDLSSPGSASGALAGADMAVNAVPGWMGLSVLEQAIHAGVDMVDISFMPEDPAHLDGFAREHGVRCIVDMGVAPGLSNMLFGRALAALGSMRKFTCRVGGLPVERRLPWQYLAPFSPIDVLEEYTRPARIVRDGRMVTLPALSEPEVYDFPGVGTLEDFLTDGLRSLLRYSDRVPEMEERTVRYPGHRDAVLLLRDSGFLSTSRIELRGGAEVSPLDLTSRLLVRSWQMKPQDRDITVMSVDAEGADGVSRKGWRLVDHYCGRTRTSSMARTTGYTCTAGVELILSGLLSKPGVMFPEDVAFLKPCFDSVKSHLEQRNIRLEEV